MIAQLLDLSRQTPSAPHLFEEKKEKYVLSLVRILRRMSSSFSHLKDYDMGKALLQLGLKSCGELTSGELTISTEITRDLKTLEAHCSK